MTVSGGRNDTVMDNTFTNNGAWGILFVPYPDRHTGSRPDLHGDRRRPRTAGFGCVYDPEGDALLRQHLQPRRVLREPEQCGLRPDRHQHGQAAELLRRATPLPTAARRRIWSRPSPPAAVDHAPRQRAAPLLAQVLCDTGLRLVSARLGLPPVDRGHHAPASRGPPDHAQPVPRGARQRVVPGGFRELRQLRRRRRLCPAEPT